MALTKRTLKMTIRSKLLLVSFLMLLIPVSILGIISYNVSKTESDSLIQKNLSNIVKMGIELTATFEHSVEMGTMSEKDAQDEVKRILIGPKNGDIRTINPKIDLGPNGYFYILDEKGNLLAHPSLEGQNILDKKTSGGFYYIKDVIEKAKNGGGFTNYDWPLPKSTKEAEKITYAAVSKKWGWIIAGGSYLQDYTTGQSRILNTIIITLLCCWAAGGLVMTLFSLHISRPLRKLANQAGQLATGDLRTEELRIRNKDEIGELAGSFATMNGSLREMASGLLTGADSLSSASNDLNAAIDHTTQATNAISVSVENVVVSSSTQERRIKDSTLAMEEMSAGIQRVASTSSTAYDASAVTLQEAEQGNRLIVQSSEQMNTVRATVNDIASIVATLGERSQEIGEIVQVMTDISSQTNLLALNASIEAARAGEQGKGFAVVAGEVKKLAERSHESARQVADLITTIQANIEQAAAAMEKGEHEVTEGVQSIEHSGEAFRRILIATRSVVSQVQEASAAAEQMSAGSQEIASALQEVRHASEQASQLAQQISASTEEQLASMEEISASANSLRAMSGDMQSLAHRFKL
ncbi:methyl-accepting chemotaxis protein [Paenibacillus mendelii]|uniref:Methyl-accepting chemotaxis protein n=1 Tax=Paenibacillus mendelii TaxID=206163 RepID=A0ABV6J6P9_9BACL|nr:methyl-accepting chemotaxis protein [Paenibacillus mendelii]MCQ6561073.1 methyl-accepting chemotaxis protein [Paenibacillus mendelii]